jgi:hypothetical protein
MERLDQDHLYPKLDVLGLTWSRPGIEPGPLRWEEARTLENSHSSNSLYIFLIIVPILIRYSTIFTKLAKFN